MTGTFGTNFNYDAIQEMNFQTGGFEAEFGQATGGIVNLVTKSGGNEFSGSLDLRYRNQDMTENGDHYDRDDAGVALPEHLRHSRRPDRARQAVVLRLAREGRHLAAGPGRPSSPASYDGWNYIGKLTWQISDANRAVAQVLGRAGR